MSLSSSFAEVILGNGESWKKLGDYETELVGEDTLPAVHSPIYVTGLARAGTTILLEALAAHPAVASHTYRDFPMLYTPYLWHKLLQWKDRIVRFRPAPVERSHQDRILVTLQSPEAFEEILWMHFFDGLHDESQNQILGADCQHPEFEAFYRNHIGKLLKVLGKSRYLAKNNYAVTRLGYLQQLFPEMRAVVMIRQPEAHVFSLRKQHRLFLAEQQQDPLKVRHTNLSGHFEFGINRKLIHCGFAAVLGSIQQLFDAGEEVRAWARYWAMLYRYVHSVRQQDNALSGALHIVRYEDLCAKSDAVLQGIFTHVGLADTDAAAIIAEYAPRLKPPDYYRMDFSETERAAIREETAEIAALFGY